jgi:hypothetical protein
VRKTRVLTSLDPFSLSLSLSLPAAKADATPIDFKDAIEDFNPASNLLIEQ